MKGDATTNFLPIKNAGYRLVCSWLSWSMFTELSFLRHMRGKYVYTCSGSRDEDSFLQPVEREKRSDRGATLQIFGETGCLRQVIYPAEAWLKDLNFLPYSLPVF